MTTELATRPMPGLMPDDFPELDTDNDFHGSRFRFRLINRGGIPIYSVQAYDWPGNLFEIEHTRKLAEDDHDDAHAA